MIEIRLLKSIHLIDSVSFFVQGLLIASITPFDFDVFHLRRENYMGDYCALTVLKVSGMLIPRVVQYTAMMKFGDTQGQSHFPAQAVVLGLNVIYRLQVSPLSLCCIDIQSVIN